MPQNKLLLLEAISNKPLLLATIKPSSRKNSRTRKNSKAKAIGDATHRPIKFENSFVSEGKENLELPTPLTIFCVHFLTQPLSIKFIFIGQELLVTITYITNIIYINSNWQWPTLHFDFNLSLIIIKNTANSFLVPVDAIFAAISFKF